MLRVEVEWEDSGLMVSDGWQSKAEILEKAHITNVFTVGWLMHQDDEALYVALSHDRNHDHYFGIQVISRPAVRNLTVLRARKGMSAEAESTTDKEDQEGVFNSPEREAGADVRLAGGPDARTHVHRHNPGEG